MPCRQDDYFGITSHFIQWHRSTVAERDSGIAPRQERSHWLSYDVSPSDDGRSLPGNRDLVVIQKLNPGQRSAGMKSWQTKVKSADARRRDPVDILVRGDR
jgi:hypothetical protein